MYDVTKELILDKALEIIDDTDWKEKFEYEKTLLILPDDIDLFTQK